METNEQSNIRNYFKNKGCQIISEIINKTSPLKYICACNIEKLESYENFLGSYCETCNKMNKKRKMPDFDFRNLCIECGVDMGYGNSRQLCGKTVCLELK